MCQVKSMKNLVEATNVIKYIINISWVSILYQYTTMIRIQSSWRVLAHASGNLDISQE